MSTSPPIAAAVARRSVEGHVGGFTLLEMLISVSLLALVITLAYGSLRVATQSSRSGERLIEQTEELRTTQGFLRRQFSQLMMTPFERLEDSGEERRFEGSAERVTFVAPMPGYLSRGGAHVQQLALVQGSKGMQLEFRFAQLNGYEADEGIPEQQRPVVLVDGIRVGRFLFRQLQPDGSLADWSEQWDEEYLLPLMIRLELEFERGDQRSWPEFEVASRLATSNATLTFDNVRPSGAPPLNPRPREAP